MNNKMNTTCAGGKIKSNFDKTANSSKSGHKLPPIKCPDYNKVFEDLEAERLALARYAGRDGVYCSIDSRRDRW